MALPIMAETRLHYCGSSLALRRKDTVRATLGSLAQTAEAMFQPAMTQISRRTRQLWESCDRNKGGALGSS